MSHKCNEIWESASCFLEAFERVSQAFPNCECEDCSASSHSRGNVPGLEMVIRLLFSPSHFNLVTMEVDKSAYRDVYIRGMSVYRQSEITVDELLAKINLEIAESKKSDRGSKKDGCGFAVATCAEIKGLFFDDRRRLCCVYDTATKDDPSHADVVYSGFRRDRKPPGSLRKDMLDNLANLFRVVRTLDDIFRIEPRGKQ